MESRGALLVATVGGSPAPIVHALSSLAPALALFVCSASSAPSVEENILPALDGTFASHLEKDVLVLENEQDLLSCVRDMRAKVSSLLCEYPNLRLCADFTGGTKVMSASLVLALADFDVRFLYVGGGARSKNGLGTVLDGEEHVFELANPWEELAFSPVQQLVEAFNACFFGRAGELCLEMAEKSGKSGFFRALGTLCEAYALWDGFALKEAAQRFSSALGTLEHLAPASMAGFLGKAKENERALTSAARELATSGFQGVASSSCLADLAANACRRMEQGRWDDAAARFYSLLEKAARMELSTSFGIDTSHVDAKSLPADYLEREKPVLGHDGALQLPLFKAYRLLAHLGNPLGLAFEKWQDRLETVLAARNNSILAHGFAPVGRERCEERCEELKELLLGFLGLDERRLPRFPRLETAFFR